MPSEYFEEIRSQVESSHAQELSFEDGSSISVGFAEDGIFVKLKPATSLPCEAPEEMPAGARAIALKFNPAAAKLFGDMIHSFADRVLLAGERAGSGVPVN